MRPDIKRAEAVDQTIRNLVEQAEDGQVSARAGWALAALGGYGRRRLAPFSDIDLVLIHSGSKEIDVDRLVQALFYPLWDINLELSHTVRSVRESVAFGREDLEWLTSTLGARFIAGDRALFTQFFEAMLALARAKRGRPFFKRVMTATAERRRRFGDAGRLREPQIKDGRGGLRDIQAVVWLVSACISHDAPIDQGAELAAAVESGLMAPEDKLALEAADEFLWELREGLHELSGRDQNKVTVDLQSKLAQQFFPDQTDDRQALGRFLYRVVRDVAAISDDFFAALAARGPNERRIPERLSFPGLLALLRQGLAGLEELEQLARSGRLEELVSEWSGIKGLTFADPNHRHPVDTHSFLVVGELVGLREDSAADAPRFDRLLAHKLSRELAHPDWLLTAGLFHDIGKGRGGAHAEVGADLFATAGGRLGLDRHAVETIGWLIRHHLLLSHTATRRDLDDPRVIDGVAAVVGDGDRLRMLYLLTLADALATGPQVWNRWRAALIDELFLKTLRSLEGESGPEMSSQIGLTEKHFELLEKEGEMVTAFWPGEDDLGELAVVAPDEPGLISRIAGVLALNKINVLAAALYTTDDGRALEVFRVAAAFEDKVNEEMYQQVKEDIVGALAGRVALSYRVDELSRRYQKKGQGRGPTRVVLDNGASEEYTVIEVHTLDDFGILYEVTTALAELNLDIHSAKASTFGDRAVDVFYVLSSNGEKITEDSYLKEIEKNILFRLSNAS